MVSPLTFHRSGEQVFHGVKTGLFPAEKSCGFQSTFSEEFAAFRFMFERDRLVSVGDDDLMGADFIAEIESYEKNVQSKR